MECNSCGHILYDECDARQRCKEPVCFEGADCLDEIEVTEGKWVELCKPCQEAHFTAMEHRKEQAEEAKGDLKFDLWYEGKLKEKAP